MAEQTNVSVPGADFLAHNMTDEERAMADAISAVMSSENIDLDRAEAVMVVAWLREHGYDVMRKPEPPPKRFFCDRDHHRGIECPERLCYWNG